MNQKWQVRLAFTLVGLAALALLGGYITYLVLEPIATLKLTGVLLGCAFFFGVIWAGITLVDWNNARKRKSKTDY